MFDIGFWEITLISVIGLIVLGPERLPVAIRSVLQWINTLKGIVHGVKSEISQELKLHELNELNENIMQEIKDPINDLTSSLQTPIDNNEENTIKAPIDNNNDTANHSKLENKPAHDNNQADNNSQSSDNK